MKNYLFILSITIVLFSCSKPSPGTPSNGLTATQNAVTITKYNDFGNIGISVLFTKTMSAEVKYTITDNGVTHTDSVYCSEGDSGTGFNSNFPIGDSSVVTNFFVTVTSVDYSYIFVNYK